MFAVALFGAGPGLYFDLAGFIFQVPRNGSAADSAIAAAITVKVKLRAIFSIRLCSFLIDRFLNLQITAVYTKTFKVLEAGSFHGDAVGSELRRERRIAPRHWSW